VTTVSLSLLLAVGQSAAQSFTRPVPGRGVGVNTLVVYTHTRPAYSLADGLESLKLRLHRVTTRLETVSISKVAPDRIADADYLVVYCPRLCSDLPKDFLRVIAETNKPVLWIGFGADQLAELVPFKGRFESSAFAAGTAVTNISYRGRDWNVTVDPWIPATLP